MARKRYVIVDLSAGPCLLGSLGVGEGTVSVSEGRVDVYMATTSMPSRVKEIGRASIRALFARGLFVVQINSYLMLSPNSAWRLSQTLFDDLV
jgi:hypothetical protein